MHASFGFSPTVSFADDDGTRIEESPLIHLCLDASALKLTASEGRTTTGIDVALPGGATTGAAPLRLTPRACVLETGGIESARLLLWPNADADGGPVAPRDALGRYWHEHPHGRAGDVARRSGIWRQEISAPGWLFFALTPEAQQAYGVLSACLRVFPSYPGEHATKGRVKRAVCAGDPISKSLFFRVDQGVDCLSPVELVSEQVPTRENRVALSDTDWDGFGAPRPVLHWTKGETDFRTCQMAMELLGRALIERRAGIVRILPQTLSGVPEPEAHWHGGHHHMGGTRMSLSASDGVVDPDPRLHGNRNCCVAGSSVFPCSGHANPTFTIVQSSLRLADHLASELAKGAL